MKTESNQKLMNVFGALTLLGLVEIATRVIFKNEVGLGIISYPFIFISPLLATVVKIICDFFIFWLILFLIFRRSVKKKSAQD